MKLQFKTNINCGGCIAQVTPFLEGENKIQSWEVDTAHPHKILTVESASISAQEVIDIVTQAGFQISKKKRLGLF